MLVAVTLIVPPVTRQARDSLLSYLHISDWSTGPPSPLIVGCATLFIAYWVTSAFRMVYACSVDTLFVCMTRDEHCMGSKYGCGKQVEVADQVRPRDRSDDNGSNGGNGSSNRPGEVT